MSAIRVMIVDDAVVVRKLVSEALSADADIEIAATAPNGKVALDKLTQVQPDLVVLDVEMPIMDGIATLTALRATHPKLPVVMFSTLTERGAKVTMDALMRGANDYVHKPANVGSVTKAQTAVREALVPKIKALAGRPKRTAPAPKRTRPDALTTPADRIDLVVIGVSTGGPAALAQIVPALPKALAAPVLICQHMPPTFTQLLANRLDSASPLHIAEARDNAPLTPGQVRIAPGDWHLEARVRGGALVTKTHQAPPENSCRPAVDVLFRSAAKATEARTLGVVLTGMGSDGALGSRQIREAGGKILIQDRSTSVVWGMPGAVAELKLASGTLPVEEIAEAIATVVGTGTPGAPGAAQGTTSQEHSGDSQGQGGATLGGTRTGTAGASGSRSRAGSGSQGSDEDTAARPGAVRSSPARPRPSARPPGRTPHTRTRSRQGGRP